MSKRTPLKAQRDSASSKACMSSLFKSASFCGSHARTRPNSFARAHRVEVLRAHDGDDAAGGVKSRRLDVEGEHFAHSFSPYNQASCFFSLH
jgi:hypothetical protein